MAIAVVALAGVLAWSIVWALTPTPPDVAAQATATATRAADQRAAGRTTTTGPIAWRPAVTSTAVGSPAETVCRSGSGKCD